MADDKITYSPEELSRMVVELRSEVNALTREVQNLRVLRNPLDDETFMDIEYVSRYLNISQRQLFRYRQSGAIKEKLIGRRVVFRTSEVKRFLEEVLSIKVHNKK